MDMTKYIPMKISAMVLMLSLPAFAVETAVHACIIRSEAIGTYFATGETRDKANKQVVVLCGNDRFCPTEADECDTETSETIKWECTAYSYNDTEHVAVGKTKIEAE